MVLARFVDVAATLLLQMSNVVQWDNFFFLRRFSLVLGVQLIGDLAEPHKECALIRIRVLIRPVLVMRRMPFRSFLGREIVRVIVSIQ